MAELSTTEEQFRDTMQACRSLFEKKLHDYGASWRILRPSSLTDQLFIKAKRIRSLEIKRETKVGEGIRTEFVALINYGIIGLIQLEKGFSDKVDITPAEAMKAYDSYAKEALSLILTKIQRVKEMEDLHEKTLVSEGIDANYMDIINYAVFGAIKLKEQETSNKVL